MMTKSCWSDTVPCHPCGWWPEAAGAPLLCWLRPTHTAGNKRMASLMHASRMGSLSVMASMESGLSGLGVPSFMMPVIGGVGW